MSGICGHFSLDGREASSAQLAPVLEHLKRRGPDRSELWSDGPVAFGHALLATTPEALVETLPLTDRESGCTITADVRLDNRDELLAALGLTGTARTIGDGELILRAYLKWQDDCVDHLLGDFAFAIWDPRSQRMFSARDHMGMRQLIYHHAPGRLFAFATDVEALIAHADVPNQINEPRIADFLDDLEGIDLTSTFFKGVHRLPPGHQLTVTPDGTSLVRYWELREQPELKLGSDQAYADAFLEVFTEAVRCRLRSAGPVGAMVSGGLDSSAVATLAGRLQSAGGAGPLATFSAIGPDPTTCVETRSIKSVLANTDLDGTTISYDDLDDYRRELANSIQNLADPFDGQMTLVRAVYLAARRKGLKVVLDGVGADLALTNGNRIAQLLRRLRLGHAVTEARAEARFWGLGEQPGLLFLAAAWAGVTPRFLRQFRQRLLARKQDRAAMAGQAGLTSSFASKIRLDQRRRLYRQHLHGVSPTGKDYQLRSISHPHTTAARERYDRIASALAIEPRDPFLDLRVIHFCLSLPRAQLRSGGWTKVVLRRAMTGFLPADVAWRRGKDHLGGRFAQAILDRSQPWMEVWAEVAPRLVGLSSRLPRSYRRGINYAIDLEPKDFIELISLGCWLARFDGNDAFRKEQ